VVGGSHPMMDYTGMLCSKEVSFWASGMGKGSLFQAGICERGTFSGKIYERVVIFEIYHLKGCRFLKFSM